MRGTLKQIFGMILIMLAVTLHAATATGTLALWKLNGNLLDSGPNGYTLIDAGSTPFTSVGCPLINQSAGVMSDINFLQGSTALETDMSDEPTLFFEGYFDLNSLGNQPVIFFVMINGLNTWMQVLTNGDIKYQFNVATMSAGASTISTGTCYYFAVVLIDGGTSKLWVSQADSISQTEVDTASFGTSDATVTNFVIGRFLPVASFAVNGYVSNFRVMNIEPDTLPVFDPGFSETAFSEGITFSENFEPDPNPVFTE